MRGENKHTSDWPRRPPGIAGWRLRAGQCDELRLLPSNMGSIGSRFFRVRTASSTSLTSWLYVQIRQGRLLIDRHPSGAHLFANKPRVIEAVRKLRNHELDRLDLRINERHR